MSNDCDYTVFYYTLSLSLLAPPPPTTPSLELERWLCYDYNILSFDDIYVGDEIRA